MYHYEVNEQAVKREKAAARELRKSRWWQSKIANQAKCHYCAKSLAKDDCTMDHIVPIVRGGKSTKGNVAIACKECNNRKKDRLVFDWSPFQTDSCQPESETSDTTRPHEPNDEAQKQ